MNNEQVKPNADDCAGCPYFVKKGSLVADRFYVKEDDCALLKTGKAECTCLVIANLGLVDSNDE